MQLNFGVEKCTKETVRTYILALNAKSVDALCGTAFIDLLPGNLNYH